MRNLWKDLKYGARMLVKTPGVTLIVILTLALGMGANTAIFAIVNGTLLRPLPVKSPEQIVVLAGKPQGDTLGVFRFSYPQLVDFRKQADSFSDLFASEIDLGGLSFGGKADQFVFCHVTGNYFSALGVKPALGRLFLPTEGEVGGKDSYVVLGYSFWQKRFGGDPGIVGKQALVNGQEATIIGVAQKGFQGTNFALDLDGYIPLNMMPPGDPVKYWTNR